MATWKLIINNKLDFLEVTKKEERIEEKKRRTDYFSLYSYIFGLIVSWLD
jgi:hypothetical protein